MQIYHDPRGQLAWFPRTMQELGPTQNMGDDNDPVLLVKIAILTVLASQPQVDYHHRTTTTGAVDGLSRRRPEGLQCCGHYMKAIYSD